MDSWPGTYWLNETINDIDNVSISSLTPTPIIDISDKVLMAKQRAINWWIDLYKSLSFCLNR